MRSAILGPLAVLDRDGQPVAIGGPQQRALLAVLLLHANRVVSAERLIDQLWGERPPATARSLLQGCVAGLRRALRGTGPDRVPLLTRAPGYLLQVRPGELDADRFEELAAAGALARVGGGAGPDRAAELLAEALSLWRGPALDDVPLDWCRAAAAGLEERRLAVLEERIDLDLQLGRHTRLVAELQTQVRDHPLRERLWEQLILALHRTDRRADALAAYQRLRRTLVEQLGVEPGESVQRLHRAVLSGEPAGTGAADPDPDPAVPAQLPAPTAGFVGRVRHLKQLNELLGQAASGELPVAVISGTAGVGKPVPGKVTQIVI